MLTLSVVTPEGQVLAQSVEEVTVPGLLGELGVLPGHVGLLTATRPGVLRYRAGAERGRIALGPGFAEVDGKGAVVALVQKAVRADKIDRGAAEKALSEAEAKLKSGDRAAEADQAWAQALLDAVKG
jgi:F-type H+-transporting ATPase subunit epsilon